MDEETPHVIEFHIGLMECEQDAAIQAATGLAEVLGAALTALESKGLPVVFLVGGAQRVDRDTLRHIQEQAVRNAARMQEEGKATLVPDAYSQAAIDRHKGQQQKYGFGHSH
jgi:hypothetical protein